MSDMREPPEFPKGHRPQVFDDPAIDQLHDAWLALATELAVAFDRIDTLERLLESRVGVARADIEGDVASEAVAADRARRRSDLAHRLLRPFREFREAAIARAQHAEAPDPEP